MSKYLFLYTCSELILDVLHNKSFFSYKWIPREQNQVCDALEKKDSTSRVPSISIIDSEYAHFQEKWLDIISKFV